MEEKRYHSGANRRTLNKSMYYFLVIVTFPLLFVLGYYTYRSISDDDGSSFTFVFTVVMTAIVMGAIFFIVIRSSRKDLWSKIEENRMRNYCILEDDGIMVHHKFTENAEKVLQKIPYSEIRFIDKCDENIKREIWKGKPMMHRWIRYLPIGGTGILYPNFTYPEDLVRIKLKKEMKITNISHNFKPVKYKTDRIYINVDRELQHEFLNEVRKRIR